MKFAIALCLLGCGKELHHTVDAPPLDTTSDVVIPDNGEPPAEAVKLTLTRYGVGVPGATVVFLDPESAVISTGITDMTGRAWALMPAGGFVTAIEHQGAGLDELTTFATVAMGDALRLDHAPLGIGMDRALDITVPLDNGADSYTIHTGCGTGGADAAGVGILDLTNCGANADVVVRSYFDGLPTGRVLYLAAVPLPTSGTVALAGPYETIEPVALTYTNVPAEAQMIGGYQAVSVASRAFEISDVVAPVGGGATVNLAIPGASTEVLTVTTVYPASTEVGQQVTYDWTDNATKTFTSNLATALLPAYSTAPAYDHTTHTVTWTERSGGTPADVVRVGLQVYRDDIPTGRAWRWRLAKAHGTPSVQFPTLPPVAGFDFNPVAGDTVAVDELTTIRLPGGLAPWRATVFGPIAQTFIGAAGHVALQTLYAPEL